MKRKPWSVIVLALFMCTILYFAGVMSGLYANKITEEKTQTSLSIFKQETQEDLASFKTEQLASLTNYIRYLETNMNTIQLQQAFLATVPEEERCSFSRISLQHMTEQLQYYRDILPYRLEEYERDNTPSEEYWRLKEQYNTLSLQTWVFAREQSLECDTSLVHGLYFYSANCETCVAQGEQLDVLTQELSRQGKDVLIFTIDAQSDDPMVEFLRAYYDITLVPAIVINDKTFIGMVTAEWLLRNL